MRVTRLAIYGATVAALVTGAFPDGAAANPAHRHPRHRFHHSVRHVVVVAPALADPAATAAGVFGGLFETGILGPTAADPYR